MSTRTSVRLLIAVAAIVALGAALAAPAGAAPSTLAVTAQEDVLGLTSRLVFSTNQQNPTAVRVATLTNTGTSAIKVTGLTLGGINANQYALAAGQAKTFTIAARGSAQLRVLFKPNGAGNKFATLTIANDSTTPSVPILLRGVRARGTLGSTEPSLAQLMQLFGYTTNVGFTSGDVATDAGAFGDEVLSPSWQRVDATQPVTLTPIARYTGANMLNGATGRTPQGTATKQLLYRFPPDTAVDQNPGDGQDDSVYVENQKTFPTLSDGTSSFTPTAPFGVYANIGNFSEDRFNRDANGVTYHNLRFYPAKSTTGVLTDTWIVGVDVNTNPPDKNFDYQDQVMLLRNAKPASGTTTADPAPGAASLNLSFNAPKASTIADKDGQGTGFTSVQANKNGTQYKPGLIDLVGGRLKITSTVGRSTGAENLQDNALQLGFDGSKTNFSAVGRLIGPMSDLNAGYQQKAVYTGPDQNNYLKIEIEHRIDKNGVFITVLREQNGGTATIGQVKVANPAAVSTLDLGIVGTRTAGTLQARYRINGGAWTNLGAAYRPPTPASFFATHARAGVLVSHTGTTKPIVGTYDSFVIS